MKSRAEYYREPGNGPGPGKPLPIPPALALKIEAARAARSQWGYPLSVGDLASTALAARCGVHRDTVGRWLRGIDRPAPAHHDEVGRWCREVLAAAAKLAGTPPRAVSRQAVWKRARSSGMPVGRPSWACPDCGGTERKKTAEGQRVCLICNPRKKGGILRQAHTPRPARAVTPNPQR